MLSVSTHKFEEKKQLYGQICKKAKQTLQQLSDVPLDQLETSHPNASLCKDCEKCLGSIASITKAASIYSIFAQ